MKSILLVCLLFLGACTATPTTGAQGVYASKAAYVGALYVATQYAKLPPCVPSEPVRACSEPKVVGSLREADRAAQLALDKAESVVRTPGVGDSATKTAIESAKAAVDVFVGITNQLDIPTI